MRTRPLVHQTSTTAGAGAQTLVSEFGRQTFAAVYGTGAANRFAYYIAHRSANELEWGIGYMSDATTLVRATVLGGSNGVTAVAFSAGIKDVTSDSAPFGELSAMGFWAAN